MNYYEVLGVSRNATQDEIKVAHRKLVKKYHPDANNGDDTNFREVQHAYNILKDPEKRKYYDDTGKDQQKENDNPFDILATIFNSLLESNSFIPDYVAAIKQSLENTIEEVNEKISETKRFITRYRKLQKRLKKKKGSKIASDFFFAALNNKIYHCEHRLKRADRVLQDTKKALKVLENYEDAGDPEELGDLKVEMYKKMKAFMEDIKNG